MYTQNTINRLGSIETLLKIQINILLTLLKTTFS